MLTSVTLERLLAVVHEPHVGLHVALVRDELAAHVALVVFPPLVDGLDVDLEVVLVLKHQVANGAASFSRSS